MQDYCLPDLRSLKTSAHVLLVTGVAPNKNYYRGQHLKYMHLVARDERPALSRKGIRKRNLRSMLSLIEVRLMERRETICNTLFFSRWSVSCCLFELQPLFPFTGRSLLNGCQGPLCRKSPVYTPSGGISSNNW